MDGPAGIHPVRAATQDHRIARLKAEAAGIGGDVRAGFHRSCRCAHSGTRTRSCEAVRAQHAARHRRPDPAIRRSPPGPPPWLRRAPGVSVSRSMNEAGRPASCAASHPWRWRQGSAHRKLRSRAMANRAPFLHWSTSNQQWLPPPWRRGRFRASGREVLIVGHLLLRHAHDSHVSPVQRHVVPVDHFRTATVA